MLIICDRKPCPYHPLFVKQLDLSKDELDAVEGGGVGGIVKRLPFSSFKLILYHLAVMAPQIVHEKHYRRRLTPVSNGSNEKSNLMLRYRSIPEEEALYTFQLADAEDQGHSLELCAFFEELLVAIPVCPCFQLYPIGLEYTLIHIDELLSSVGYLEIAIKLLEPRFSHFDLFCRGQCISGIGGFEPNSPRKIKVPQVGWGY